MSIFMTNLQATLSEYSQKIKIGNCSHPTRAKRNNFYLFSFKPHRPLSSHHHEGSDNQNFTSQPQLILQRHVNKNWKKEIQELPHSLTSLLFAQLQNGRYMSVLKCFSPLQGFAKTLPFSLNDAMVNPKWSVMDGTRGPLPVSWKSICIQSRETYQSKAYN